MIATTATATARGTAFGDPKDSEGWPGIVSRFQLVLLASRRSKELFNGAQPRIPVDPLRRRNTSIALEELRRGLVPIKDRNGDEPAVNTTVAAHVPHFDLLKAE